LSIAGTLDKGDTYEVELAERILDAATENDILIYDRGYCSYKDQCEGKGHLPPLLLKLENLLSFSRTQVGNRLVIILNIFLMIDDSHDLSKAGLMRHQLNLAYSVT
jgi:hypothetical protein